MATDASDSASGTRARDDSTTAAGHFPRPLEHRDSAIDSLCCGITTLRDGNGVAVPGNVASVSDEERERLISAGYARDEMFPDVTLPAAMDLISLDWGYVNNLRVRDLSAGNWRDFISRAAGRRRARWSNVRPDPRWDLSLSPAPAARVSVPPVRDQTRGGESGAGVTPRRRRESSLVRDA